MGNRVYGTIQPRSRTEMVVETISTSILQKVFADKELIPSEDVLCQQLGVSRTVLREAMKVLEAKGLIEIKQGCGTFVRKPGGKSVEESFHVFMQTNSISLIQLMEVRTPIEIEIVKLAALRRKENHLTEIKKTLKILQNHPTDLDACVEADTEFHKILVVATQNPIFEIIMGSIMKFLRYSRQMTISHYGTEKVIKHHRAITESVEKKDPKSASLHMKLHMQMALNDLMRLSKNS